MTLAARAAAVVPAAGRGDRLARGVPKALVPLRGRPLIQYPLMALQRAAEVESIAVVVPRDAVAAVQRLAQQAGLSKVSSIVPGGPDRQASVALGLQALPPGPDLVLVHDAARPFLSPALIVDVIAAAARDGAATAAVPVDDTIKRGEDGWVQETLDRSRLYRIQTPQAFHRTLLEQAHRDAERRGIRGTDDAVLVERLGARVRLVPGTATNIKITVPDDLALAEALVAVDSSDDPPERAPRVGIGFDAHRFGAGRRLILGGVEVPHPRGLIGHSDADVIVHAVMDALLGAAGCGDIGHHFPPDDPAFEGASSLGLLALVRDLLSARGWRPAHVDVVVMAEAPRLAPHIPTMRAAMAQVLHVPPERVNVKATTVEGMGALGREEGIAAQAVASLETLSASSRGDAPA